MMIALIIYQPTHTHKNTHTHTHSHTHTHTRHITELMIINHVDDESEEVYDDMKFYFSTPPFRP